MNRVSTYLNFPGNTEDAFHFYEGVFNSKITSLTRMGDMPRPEGAPAFPEDALNKVMNVQLPIVNGHMLMATDAIEAMGHVVKVGNNVTIALDLDSREEADKIYSALADGSTEGSGMADMPWGAYWGSCEDRFGIRWMVSFAA